MSLFVLITDSQFTVQSKISTSLDDAKEVDDNLYDIVNTNVISTGGSKVDAVCFDENNG